MAELTRSISSEVTFSESDRLLERLKEGDEAAFTEVFHLHKDMVYTLAFKLLADKAESMDVTQEVFFTLYKKVHSFRGDCSLKTWLYRVAINQASNRNRWWKRRFLGKTSSLNVSPVGNSDSPPREVAGRGPSPLRCCYSQELHQAIQGALGKLPFEQRVAVVLRDVEGLTYEEIAEITAAQVGTIKSRIARGREKLREFLGGLQGGERL